MPNKRSIKEQILFNNQMKRLIQALKDIDAAHFQTLNKQKLAKFEKFDGFFKGFAQIADFINTEHPLLNTKTESLGIIAITSDQAFMGKLNSQVCKAAIDLAGDNSVEYIVVGKKGTARLRNTGQRISVFPAIIEKRRYEQAIRIKDYVIKQCMDQKIGKVYLIYTHAISFTVQKVAVVKLLPAVEIFGNPEELKNISRPDPRELCLESYFNDIVEYLVEMWISGKLYETFYDAKLAEYASRSVQLEASMQYLLDEAKKLSLNFNKARQEEVDKGSRETFSAMLGVSM